jgi:hypothetical protein
MELAGSNPAVGLTACVVKPAYTRGRKPVFVFLRLLICKKAAVQGYGYFDTIAELVGSSPACRICGSSSEVQNVAQE